MPTNYKETEVITRLYIFNEMSIINIIIYVQYSGKRKDIVTAVITTCVCFLPSIDNKKFLIGYGNLNNSLPKKCCDISGEATSDIREEENILR